MILYKKKSQYCQNSPKYSWSCESWRAFSVDTSGRFFDWANGTGGKVVAFSHLIPSIFATSRSNHHGHLVPLSPLPIAARACCPLARPSGRRHHSCAAATRSVLCRREGGDHVRLRLTPSCLARAAIYSFTLTRIVSVPPSRSRPSPRASWICAPSSTRPTLASAPPKRPRLPSSNISSSSSNSSIDSPRARLSISTANILLTSLRRTHRRASLCHTTTPMPLLASSRMPRTRTRRTPHTKPPGPIPDALHRRPFSRPTRTTMCALPGQAPRRGRRQCRRHIARRRRKHHLRPRAGVVQDIPSHHHSLPTT